MIYWKCSICKRMRTYDTNKKIILKACPSCQVPMEIFEEKTLEAIQNG